MKTRILGKSGLCVSVVGFGGIPLQRVSPGDSTLMINKAFDLGMNFIDTARGYTDSEEKIGKAISSRRNDVVLATKSMARDAKAMTADVETSLRLLQTDVIDLYQLHGVHTEDDLKQVLAPGGALEALHSARELGDIRHIGITGHTRTVLVEAMETGLFETVQTPFNPIETEALDDVIPAARKHNVGIIGMKPVAGGAFKNVQAALRFSLKEGVDVVIPGMDAIEQVEQNAEVGVDFRDLTSTEKQQIEREKEIWSGVFCRRCNYCQPCKNDLNISFLLLLQAYYERYGLREWALERLDTLDKKYVDCLECGECVERCPYDLPIPELLKKAAAQLGD